MNLQQWQADIVARLTELEQEIRTLRAFKSEMSDKMLRLVESKLTEMKQLVASATVGATAGQGENRHITMRDVYISAAFLAMGWAAALAYIHK